jgi:hypothetical protein
MWANIFLLTDLVTGLGIKTDVVSDGGTWGEAVFLQAMQIINNGIKRNLLFMINSRDFVDLS